MLRFPKSLALAGLLVPFGANALGVGDIRMRSGMNQYAEGEIPLVLSGSDSLNDIRVSLASPEEFARAGIERHYYLTKLQFRPIQRPDGRYAIRVSSREAMREPFLNFLVEVNWPHGRALREFTVLLDPPSATPEPPAAEDEPVIQRPRPSYAPPRPAARVAEISHSNDAPPRPRKHRRSISATPESPPSAPVESRAAPAESPAPSANTLPPPDQDQYTGETYGPVRREETLWGIAKNMDRDPSVTQEQLAMGLYRANRHAFGGSINSLRAGAILKIPSQEFIAELSPEEARAAFGRKQGWRGGRIAAQRDRGPAMPAESFPPQSQVKLLSPPAAAARGESSVAGNDGGATPASKVRGDLALEVAETVKQENEEFRSRLAQLEQKLTEMQRLLVLKEEQIGTLLAKQRSEAAAPPPEAKPRTPAVEQPAPAAIPARPVVPISPAPAPLPAPVATTRPAVPPPAPAPVSPAAVQPAPVPPVPAPPPVAKAPATGKAGPQDALLPVDPTYLGIAGGLGLLGLGAWLLKRRRDALIAESDTIPLGIDDARGQAVTSADALALDGQDNSPAIRDAVFNEYFPDAYDVLAGDVDEVDPAAEADVYLAYGRNKQAEDLMRNAIAHHPERDDFRLKLLEVFRTTENREGFEAYVKELLDEKLDVRRGFWAEVQARIREFAPDSGLLSGELPEELSEPQDSRPRLGDLNLTDEDLIGDLRRFGDDATEPFPSLAEIDLEGASADAEPEPADAGLPDIDGDGLHQALRIFEEAETVDAESLGDLDLFDEGRVVEFAKDGKEDSAADSESIDELLNFDFSAGDGDLASGDRFPPLSDFGSLQSDSGDGTPPKDPLWDLEDILALDPEDESVRGDGDLGGDDTGRSEKSIEDILRELTRDLQPEDPAEVDSPESGVQPTGTASLELRLAPALPGADFSLDDRASVLKEFVDLDSGFLDDLSDLDQFETKLDLARAYADMGDGDAAREILLDVAAHGNDKQRIEADELLAKLPDLDPATFLPRAKSA